MSVLYAAYNSVMLIPVLIPIRKFITKKKHIKYISVIVTLITITLLFIIYSFLINIDINISQIEMPALYAASKIHPYIKNIYGVIIFVSIFTTAISLGISFLNNVVKNSKKYNNVAILICVTSILFSKIGFSNLVSNLYPILGILGLFQVIQILKI